MTDNAKQNAQGWYESIVDLVARSKDGDEAAYDEIQEGPLSIQVRSDWQSPTGDNLDASDGEYFILLSTGGPALRIFGDLGGHCSPINARLQWQDWGTPWTDFDPETDSVVHEYAAQFYFGE